MCVCMCAYGFMVCEKPNMGTGANMKQNNPRICGQ